MLNKNETEIRCQQIRSYLNTNEFNSFDRKAEKILREIFNKGEKIGKKEAIKQIIKKIQSIK